MPGRIYPTPESEKLQPVSGAGTATTPVTIYLHNFNDTPSVHPYLTQAPTQNANITNSKWTNSKGVWTSFNSNTTTYKYTLAIDGLPSNTDSTTRIKLEFDVAEGKTLSVTSFNFMNRSTTTGYPNYSLNINGIDVGSGSLNVSSSTTMQSAGGNVTNPVNNLTGHITVMLTLSGSHSSTGTFRMDNFTLNGYMQQLPGAVSAGNATGKDGKYLYGFNGKRYDNEVYGAGNFQDYGMRVYDPRIVRFPSVDPITKKYPELTPYQFASNIPIAAVDIDGKEAWIAIYTTHDGRNTQLKMVFDKDVVNPGGVYVIHRYFKTAPDGSSQLIFQRWGSDNYSSYSNFFPNFSRGVRDKFSFSSFFSSFNLKAQANVLFGELALKPKVGGIELGGSVGVEGKLIGLNLDVQDRTGKLPILGWNSTMKKTDGELNVGGDISLGAGLGYRRKMDFNTNEFKDDDEISYNGIITSGSINTFKKDAKLSFGIGFKAAVGFGGNVDAKFELNMTKMANALKPLSIKYTGYEKQELNAEEDSKKLSFDVNKY